MRKLTPAIFLFLLTTCAYAKDRHIQIIACDGVRDYHECATVTITGQIFPADLAAFTERTKDIQTAHIVLSGPGGALRPAINIGEQIHFKHWDTFVPAGEQCLSACAYIWLAGDTRDMGKQAVLMWHSAFMGGDDQHADGNGNAILGMYLAHLGFSYDAVDWMIGNDPNDEKAVFRDANGVLSEKQFRFVRSSQ
jgi:hypothetical protein